MGFSSQILHNCGSQAFIHHFCSPPTFSIGEVPTFHFLCLRGCHCCHQKPSPLQCALGEGGCLCEFFPLLCIQTHLYLCLCCSDGVLESPEAGWTSTNSLSPVNICPVLHSPGFLSPHHGKWWWVRQVHQTPWIHSPYYGPVIFAQVGWCVPWCNVQRHFCSVMEV